jgi:type I restriction enzyme M protein
LIARENPVLQGVFDGIKFDTPRFGSESQRENLLRKLLDIFAVEGLDLPTLDDEPRTALIYDDLVQKFADGKRIGSFSTPASLSSLLVRLLDPHPGMQICDPTCGSGSLLLHAAKHIQENYSSSNYSLNGQEENGTYWALAQLNLLLHGEDAFRIELDDTLQHPKLLDERGQLIQYDIGISHIPFGATWADESAVYDSHERFIRGVPPKKRPEYAFILHLISTMKPQAGRVGIIVPLGALFREGVEMTIRESLIRDRLLDAVIELPAGLLFGTSITAAIILFRAGKSDNSVVFIDASKSYHAGKLNNRLAESDISRILEAYKNRQDVLTFCHVASLAEIADNDYNLNVRRYVTDENITMFRNPSDIRNERAALEERLNSLDIKMRDYIDDLKKRFRDK